VHLLVAAIFISILRGEEREQLTAANPVMVIVPAKLLEWCEALRESPHTHPTSARLWNVIKTETFGKRLRELSGTFLRNRRCSRY
jgi:hypothetical protein